MESSSLASELAVTLGAPEASGAETPSPAAAARRRFAGVRERVTSWKADRSSSAAADDEAEMRLELMLLREQNMRLLSDRHRPFDLGMLLDQLRLRLSATDRVSSTDEAWAILSEYLLLRENLGQANTELETAIAQMRAQLAVGTDQSVAQAA